MAIPARIRLLIAVSVLGACARQQQQGAVPLRDGAAAPEGTGGSSEGGSGGGVSGGGVSGGGGAPADVAITPIDVGVTAIDVAPSGVPPSADGDEVPDRPLAADRTNPQLYATRFKPSDADPMTKGRDEVQTALVDTSKPLLGKLVVVLSGTNGSPGPGEVASFAAGLGFHAYAMAYHNEWNPSTQNNADVFGNSRFNELDGMGRTPAMVTVTRADSVEERVARALAYLQTKNAAGDWSYFLDKGGQVRWSDVVFIGHSHGATSSAAYAKKHRLWRAISLSGPRDTNPVVATWLRMPSATPIERYYGFTGTTDAQHPDHIKAMEVMGYLGTLTPVEGAQPPFQNSHRLQYNGGHGGSASCATYAAVCKYMLGVP